MHVFLARFDSLATPRTLPSSLGRMLSPLGPRSSLHDDTKIRPAYHGKKRIINICRRERDLMNHLLWGKWMDYTILPVNKTKSTILHRPKRKTITRFCQWNDKTKPSPLTRPTKQDKSQHPVVVGKYSFTTTISVHLVRSSVVMLCWAPAPTSGVIISLQWESPTSQLRTRSEYM